MYTCVDFVAECKGVDSFGAVIGITLGVAVVEFSSIFVLG